MDMGCIQGLRHRAYAEKLAVMMMLLVHITPVGIKGVVEVEGFARQYMPSNVSNEPLPFHVSCGNLNFARRTHCNNCNKYRYAPEVYEPRRSPRRVYLSPPPRGPARSPPPRGPARIGGPPVERAPLRETAGYRSPPRVWGIGDRGYASRSPPADRAGRFAEPPLKERMVFRGDRDPRDRAKFDWSVTDGYNQRERPRDGMYLDRSRRRSGSPRDNWGSDLRDRSRSPRNRLMKSSFAGRGPPDDYTDPYMSRGRPNNLETGRGRGRGYRPGGGPYPGEGRGDRHAAPHARNDDGY
ncbi:hypothetical protein PR202_gb22946 [Eleusine coracana subsp. coracana]|uniref:Uncharacterized protein n=1 Tax=Eleusine coracana subsp. coracana TaxID=191504 RepID=A0AAV5FHT8_ELECO|nr:hypothetical protein PR202_gb22946 [Eleusine coracana subsp. coracana]